MKNATVTLVPLEAADRKQFILDNQKAFKFGALEEFGLRNDHFEDDGEIISRQTIEASIDAEGAQALRIMQDGQVVGGAIVKIDSQTQHNHLDILFVSPAAHGRGIGFSAWKAIEERYPDTKVWETCTPYFEMRNIHFYINKCGFHAVEFWTRFHQNPNDPEAQQISDDSSEEAFAMFRFQKNMK